MASRAVGAKRGRCARTAIKHLYEKRPTDGISVLVGKVKGAMTNNTPLNADDELKTKASDSSSEAGYPIIPELYEYCLGAGLELSNYQAVELTKLILADRKKHELQARIGELGWAKTASVWNIDVRVAELEQELENYGHR